VARHAAPHTRCVALADAAATNVFRHSVHRPRIPGTCAAGGAAATGATRHRYRATATTTTATAKVDQYPAAVADRFTRRGGSISRRQVDPT
jgi:hypothetical protein